MKLVARKLWHDRRIWWFALFVFLMFAALIVRLADLQVFPHVRAVYQDGSVESE